MGEITAPIIAITLVLLSVFVPVGVHSRHLRPAVPAVRGRGVGLDGDLGDQRADPVAGALRGVPAAPSRAEARRRCATCCGGIDWRARRLRRRRARARARSRCSASSCSPWSMARRRLAVQGHADRLPARRRTRARSSSRCSCPRAPRSTAPTRSPSAVEEIAAQASPGVADVTSVVGYSMLDGLTKSNSALLVIVRSSRSRERTDAALSANAHHRQAARASCRRSARRNVFAFNLPPIIGLGTGGGFEYQLLDLEGGEPGRSCGGRARPGVRRQPGPALARVFTTYSANTPQLYLDIDRDKAADARRRLSRRLQRAAGDARRLLRQRLQPVRPHLAGQHPGRGRRPRHDRRHLPHQRAQPATATWCRCAPSPSVRLILGPQSIIRYNNYRSVTINGSPAPGAARARRSPRWRRSPPTTLPPGYSYEWTGTALQEKEAAGQTTIDPRARRAVRLPVPGRRSTRAGRSRSRCCCRSRSACSAPWRRCGSRASTTTSTPRSASSC